MAHYQVRNTISKQIELSGIGLHSGNEVCVRLLPTAPNSGILFRRTDIAGSKAIPALWNLVGSLTLCTELKDGDVKISTVEHLMCALSATGIHDVIVEVSGPEIPIMDGSAAPFVNAIKHAGRKPSCSPLYSIKILKSISMQDGDRKACFNPGPDRHFDFTIDFTNPVVGRSRFGCSPDDGSFHSAVAPARTFAFEKDILTMRKMGLALGGSLKNAIVVGDGRVLNPTGLRFSNEFARHKTLDAIGDTYLAGAPIIGTYVAEKAGHALNNALLHTMMQNTASWTWTLTPEINAAREYIAA